MSQKDGSAPVNILDVTIPQMGEGLQDARLVRLLKQPGDRIARDEPIFEMETDKATMQIEAPVSGVLLEWLVAEDAIVPIGAVVGRIESSDYVDTGASTRAPRPSESPSPQRAFQEGTTKARNVVIPPRTRAYARECGLTDDDLLGVVSASGGKILPADIDAWLALRQSEATAEPSQDYEDVPMPAGQRTLVFRLTQRSGEVIPASEEIEVDWAPIDRVRQELKVLARSSSSEAPTPFLLFAWCLVQASRRHDVFRSTYQGSGLVRRHRNLHLGIAVARGDDELLTARVEAADGLSFGDFVLEARRAIKRARAGEDQASSLMQLTLSNLTGWGITRATPVVAAPAVGTVFVGAVRERLELRDGTVQARRVATVSLTFDHRMTNGVGAARFLADIASEVAALSSERLAGG